MCSPQICIEKATVWERINLMARLTGIISIPSHVCGGLLRPGRILQMPRHMTSGTRCMVQVCGAGDRGDTPGTPLGPEINPIQTLLRLMLILGTRGNFTRLVLCALHTLSHLVPPLVWVYPISPKHAPQLLQGDLHAAGTAMLCRQWRDGHRSTKMLAMDRMDGCASDGGAI